MHIAGVRQIEGLMQYQAQQGMAWDILMTFEPGVVGVTLKRIGARAVYS